MATLIGRSNDVAMVVTLLLVSFILTIVIGPSTCLPATYVIDGPITEEWPTRERYEQLMAQAAAAASAHSQQQQSKSSQQHHTQHNTLLSNNNNNGESAAAAANEQELLAEAASRLILMGFNGDNNQQRQEQKQQQLQQTESNQNSAEPSDDSAHNNNNNYEDDELEEEFREEQQVAEDMMALLERQQAIIDRHMIRSRDAIKVCGTELQELLHNLCGGIFVSDPKSSGKGGSEAAPEIVQPTIILPNGRVLPNKHKRYVLSRLNRTSTITTADNRDGNNNNVDLLIGAAEGPTVVTAAHTVRARRTHSSHTTIGRYGRELLGLSDECCKKHCSIQTLMSFCGKKSN